MKLTFDVLETSDGYAVNPPSNLSADQCLVLAAYLKCVLDDSYGKGSSEAIEYLAECFGKKQEMIQ